MIIGELIVHLLVLVQNNKKIVEDSFLMGYDAASLGNWFAVFSRDIVPSAVWTLWAIDNEGNRR